MEHIKGVQATVEQKDREILQVWIENENMRNETMQLREVITNLERSCICLRFNNLRSDGFLGKYRRNSRPSLTLKATPFSLISSITLMDGNLVTDCART